MTIFTKKSILAGLAVSAMTLTLTGCSMIGLGGPSEAKLEVDPNPAAFSGDVASFVAGKWCLSNRASTQLPGITASQAAEMAEPDSSKYWEFLPDGKLIMKTKALPHSVGGTWKAEGSGITLAYTSYGGQPMETARKMLQAGAESGTSGGIRNELVSDWLFQSLPKYTQVTLGEDKKTLEFAGGAGIPGMEAMSEGEKSLLGKMAAETLVRMKEKS